MQVTIIPIVIGAFGTVTKGLLKGLEDLEVGGLLETIQTTALLRTARILRRVLETWEDLLSLRQPLNEYGRYQTDCQKWKSIEKPNTYSEKYAVKILKWNLPWKAGNDTCQMESNNKIKKKIKMVGEKETYTCLGIWGADTIKQDEMKEERESYSRQNYLAGTLSNKYLASPPRKILETILEVKKRPQTKRPDNKKNKWPYIRTYIPEMTLTDYMSQENKYEEDLLALKTALTHRDDSKTT